jgi:hypothetical protein
MQLFGHKNAEIAKRIDIAGTAIFHGMAIEGLSDLDLSSTPPWAAPGGSGPGGRHCADHIDPLSSCAGC